MWSTHSQPVGCSITQCPLGFVTTVQFSNFHMPSLLFQKLCHCWLWQADTHSVPACAHTRTQLKRSYGKMLLRLGQVLCWLSLIWMVTQRFGLCVCVCCVFCVLALAHIQILPPLPSSLETTTTPLPSLPLLPCGRQCGRSLVAAHAHTPTCPPPPAHTTHQLFRDLGKASYLTYRTPTYYSPWGRKQAGNCISEGNKSQEMWSLMSSGFWATVMAC